MTTETDVVETIDDADDSDEIVFDEDEYLEVIDDEGDIVEPELPATDTEVVTATASEDGEVYQYNLTIDRIVSGG